MIRILALPLVFALVGCGGDEPTGSTDDPVGAGGGGGAGGAEGAGASDGSTIPAATGTAVLSFKLGGSSAGSPNLVDELVGPVYGAIYWTSDVTLMGPEADAVSVAAADVENLDLTEVDVSEGLFEVELAPGAYTFLGFWDLDESSATSDAGEPRPENGDPVPLADTNQFTITENETTSFTVAFDLIYAFD